MLYCKYLLQILGCIVVFLLRMPMGEQIVNPAGSPLAAKSFVYGFAFLLLSLLLNASFWLYEIGLYLFCLICVIYWFSGQPQTHKDIYDFVISNLCTVGKLCIIGVLAYMPVLDQRDEAVLCLFSLSLMMLLLSLVMMVSPALGAILMWSKPVYPRRINSTAYNEFGLINAQNFVQGNYVNNADPSKNN